MTLPPRRKMVRPPTGGSEEGRGKPARLKTAKMRTPSSQAWLSRQINDPWAAKARAHGYRSRAAYKLTDIADRFGLLLPGQRVIDLGAAPGGWTQVALERGIRRIVGVDLLPVEPLPPAEILEMDFTDPACGDLLVERLGGPPDLVISDMAPNTSGHGDDLLSARLCRRVLELLPGLLAQGGSMCMKIFEGYFI